MKATAHMQRPYVRTATIDVSYTESLMCQLAVLSLVCCERDDDTHSQDFTTSATPPTSAHNVRYEPSMDAVAVITARLP